MNPGSFNVPPNNPGGGGKSSIGARSCPASAPSLHSSSTLRGMPLTMAPYMKFAAATVVPAATVSSTLVGELIEAIVVVRSAPAAPAPVTMTALPISAALKVALAEVNVWSVAVIAPSVLLMVTNEDSGISIKVKNGPNSPRPACGAPMPQRSSPLLLVSGAVITIVSPVWTTTTFEGRDAIDLAPVLERIRQITSARVPAMSSVPENPAPGSLVKIVGAEGWASPAW